ncbi:MAG: hypothetical protein EAX96_21140 [Candidatus Lokiarchaeota archaeon]|nr:hypothetical protein [Candidatus Lokiarchaeota archaeon]
MSSNQKEREIFASLQHDHTALTKIDEARKEEQKKVCNVFNELMTKNIEENIKNWNLLETAKSNVIMELNLGNNLRIAAAWSLLRKETLSDEINTKYFNMLKAEIMRIVDYELSRTTKRMGEGSHMDRKINRTYLARTMGILNKENMTREFEFEGDED